MRLGGKLGRASQRSQSVSVFRHAALGAPDVVAGQVDVLPTERRQVSQQMVGHILGPSKGCDGALEVSRVPQDDCGDEQVEAGGAVLLVLVGAVADFPEPMDEDRARQAVAGFALVQLLTGFAAQLGFADPVEREQRTLQPSQLAQRGGNAVLPRVGGELAHDQRRRHGAGADGGDDAQDLRPMGADEGDVDAAGDHRFQRGIGGRLAEAVEPAVLQVRDARRELEAKQAAQREDMVGIAAAIGVVPSRRDLALMVEQRVEHVQRLARRRRDQLGVERRVAVREVGVDLEAGSLAVVGVQPGCVTAEAGGLEELAVR